MRKEIRSNIVGMMIILLISLLLSFVLLYYFMYQVNGMNEKESLNMVLETTEQVNSNFQSKMEDTWMQLNMAQEAVSYVAAEQTGEAASILLKMKECAAADQFYLLNVSGKYVSADGKSGNWKNWDLEEAVEEALLSQSQVNLLRHNGRGEECLIFIMPTNSIQIENETMGFLLAEYKLETFLEVLKLESFSKKGQVLVIDGSGECMFQTNGTENFACGCQFFQTLDGEAFTNNEKIQDAESLQEQIKLGNRGVVCVSKGEKKLVLCFVPLETMDWSLILLVDHEVIDEMKTENAAEVGKIAFILIFLAVVVCFAAYLVVTCLTDKRTGELLRNRESLMNIISSDAMGIYILASENDTICRYASSDVMPILGVPMELLIGHSIFEVLNELGLNDLVCRMQEWDRKANLEVKNICYVHPVSKEEIYLRCKCFVPNAGEVAVSIINETAEVQGELALRAAMNAAEAASNSKSKFLSSMSHDMRTPMNAIIGLSTLLEKNAEDAKRVKSYAKKITASSQHLLGIINDILDMSKIESGKVKLNISEFDLAAVLEDVQTIIMPQIEAKNQSFEIRTSGIREEHLMGDQVRINQILLNLLSNAVKYTPEGGNILLQITAVVPKRVSKYIQLRFEVIDDGMGMSEEFIKDIFQPFAREESSTISGIQGTGLGMSITYNLVKMMGGALNVESEPGVGSTFTVELKLRPAAAKKGSGSWSQYGISEILVATGEINQCIDIQNVMAEADAHVDYVTNANCVMRQMERVLKGELSYDMILLDRRIKGMDVLELVEEVRKCTGTNMLIIMLTDYEWSEEEKMKAVGVDGFLVKPFFVSNLRKLVAQLRGGVLPEIALEDVTPFSGVRFLIAEDNEINAEVLQELLEDEGAKMDIVENGKLALEKFENSKPGYYDMILMDVQMPVMNGYDASRAIRVCNHPDAEEISIVAMTANAFMEDVQEALNAGMNAHVAKPVNMNVFRECALELLAAKERKEREKKHE